MKHTKQPTANITQRITLTFMEFLVMVKLFHWKTTSFAVHKATDEAYTRFNASMDSFIELLLGNTASRVDLTNVTTIPCTDCTSVSEFKTHIETFKTFLVGLDQMHLTSDLYTIRDTMLGDMNQLLYLLTLHG